MKIIKLIPVIVKNFVLIIFWETKKLFRGRTYLTLILLATILAGAIWGGIAYYKHRRYEMIYGDVTTLEEAAKMGEMTTHKLLVQIETPRGREEDLKGRYQRGDVVLTKPADFQFSEAEKTGFLILHMDLTEKQAMILVQSKKIDTGKNDQDGRPKTDTATRRRFAVDLGKIGIPDTDEKGREITDKVYKWDILIEKK
jgi:hypothetical protein